MSRPTKVAAMPELPARAVGARILVVDDDPYALDATKAIANRLGLTVYSCTNGLDAISQRFGIAVPSLISMNLGMPELSGADATRLIRRREGDEGRPRVPILLESGTEPGHLASIAAMCGADAWLGRPCPPEAWASAVIALAWPEPKA